MNLQNLIGGKRCWTLCAAAGLAFAAWPVMAQPPAADKAPEKAAAPAPAKATLTLKNAGEGEKRKLRFAVKEGTTQTTEVVMAMKVRVKMEGMEMPEMAQPTLISPMQTSYSKIEGGEFTATTTMGKGRVEGEGPMPGMADAMNDALGSMAGTKMIMRMTDRGEVKSTELKLADGADPAMEQMSGQLRQSMSQSMVMLPEEPVGVGAEWSVELPLEAMGMKSTTISTFKLTKVDAEGFEAAVTMEQSAKEQEMKMPGMPEGMPPMRLMSLSGKGTGTTVVKFNAVVPSAQKINTKMEMALKMDMMGEAREMKQGMDMTMEIREAKPEAMGAKNDEKKDNKGDTKNADKPKF